MEKTRKADGRSQMADGGEEQGVVIARCPRCAEPVLHGRCSAAACDYALPALRQLNTEDRKPMADGRTNPQLPTRRAA